MKYIYLPVLIFWVPLGLLSTGKGTCLYKEQGGQILTSLACCQVIKKKNLSHYYFFLLNFLFVLLCFETWLLCVALTVLEVVL